MYQQQQDGERNAGGTSSFLAASDQEVKVAQCCRVEQPANKEKEKGIEKNITDLIMNM